jgi:hypothetical protein
MTNDRLTVNALVRMQEESVWESFKVLHWQLREGTEENHENLSQYRASRTVLEPETRH